MLFDYFDVETFYKDTRKDNRKDNSAHTHGRAYTHKNTHKHTRVTHTHKHTHTHKSGRISVPLVTMARRAGHFRSFFIPAVILHTHLLTPHWFCGRSGAISSINHPPGVFRRSAPKNTSLASRTSVTSSHDAGTFAQRRGSIHANRCQRGTCSCLVAVWLFESAQRLLYVMVLGRSTREDTPLSSTQGPLLLQTGWSFRATRSVNRKWF